VLDLADRALDHDGALFQRGDPLLRGIGFEHSCRHGIHSHGNVREGDRADILRTLVLEPCFHRLDPSRRLLLQTPGTFRHRCGCTEQGSHEPNHPDQHFKACWSRTPGDFPR
jgi:hypothetical protein